MDDQHAILLLNDPGASEAALLALIQDTEADGELRDAALNDPRVRDDTVRELLTCSSGPRRQRLLAALERPRVLADWAEASDAEDRALVAFNPHTPADAVRRLAQDESAHVRANTVFNPCLSDAEVGEIAVRDPDADVRDAAETALATVTGWSMRQGRRWVWEPETES